MSTVSEAVEDCPADRCAGRTGRREAFCGVHQRHASSSGNTAGAAEDQRRTTYIFTSVRERRGSALASQRTGLTSVETGGRWSSGGRCCQRFSRFRRAATRYYAAEPARTDLHRSAHRDVASPAAVAVPWHQSKCRRSSAGPPLLQRSYSPPGACQRSRVPSIPPGAAGSLRVDSRAIRFGSSMMLLGWGGVFASITDSTSFPARSPIATLC